MFKVNEDKSIHVTRGDYCEIPVPAVINGVASKFKNGDIVRLKATKKKDCNAVVIQRECLVEAETDEITIPLTGDDTRIGPVISKPTDYWYEVELNPDNNPQTLIGYDEDGAKILRLFPEGADVNAEDIEVVGKKTLQDLVNDALEQAKESGEFDGPQGPAGPKGEKGDDYELTDANMQEITELVLATGTLQQIQQDLADLKYVPIDITSLTNNVGTVEMGASVKEVTFNWKLNKEPTGQTFDGEDVDVLSREAFVSYHPLLAIKENKTFTLIVTDERGATDSANTAISFLNGVYYGVLESGAEVDSAAILALTRKLQGSRGITFTANAGATQQIIYAIPTRYGTPNFNVGGFDGGFAKAKTFDFTNASGYTESYDVWLSENVGLGSTTVKVS